MNPRDLLDEIEDQLRKEGLLDEADDVLDMPDPPRRVVELGPDHHAVFTGEPENSLWVFKADAEQPLKIPYFDPGNLSDDTLREKLGRYRVFT